MAAPSTLSWFPVMTLLIGYLAGFLSEWFRDRRTTIREREARQAMRTTVIADRRAEFQRQALLELQDAVSQLARATGVIHHQDTMAYKSSGKWGQNRLINNWDEEFRKAQVRTTILAARVRDDVVRGLVERFRNDCTDVIVATTQPDSDNYLMKSFDTNNALQERVGIVIRALDDD